MKYLCLSIDSFPFKPTERQVIYIDSPVISMKLRRPVARLIESGYGYISDMFKRAGLEFCYLPVISSSLNIDELYHYFCPDKSDKEIITLKNKAYRELECYSFERFLYNIFGPDSSRFIIEEGPGLLKYMGSNFDKDGDYVFSYYALKGSENERDFSPSVYLRQIQSYLDVFGEPAVEDKQTEDDKELMSEAVRLVNRMRNNGIDEMLIQQIFQPTRMLSRLKITGSGLFLVDYNNMEIKMGKLPKTVFLFYLRHPDGIAFSDLENYYDELLHIYESITGREDEQGIRNSILDLTLPETNSINEKCSRIRQAFVSKIDDDLARNYYITGERGGIRKISLPREMVIWD